MVHQHFRLVAPFTVAENVVLGDHRAEGRSLLRPPRRAIERAVAELGERYGLDVDPRARIWQLSVGEQQRVEILKALYREARILIMDEPTAVLTPQEAEALFATLRAMADEGKTVIFISHKLHEVMAVADRVTVLRGGRDGRRPSTAAAATPRSLAALMVGREIEVARPLEERARQLADVLALEVEGLTVHGRSRRDGGAATSRSRSARARSSASPGWPATASASSPRRSPGCVTSVGGDDPRRRRVRCAAAIRARRSSPASRTSPRIGSGRGSRPSLSVTSNAVHQDVSRAARCRAGRCSRCGACATRRSGSSERYDVKTPGPGHAGAQPLGRQPPEARPRPRVRGRPARARRRPADARARRRRDRDGARVPPRRGGRAASRSC